MLFITFINSYLVRVSVVNDRLGSFILFHKPFPLLLCLDMYYMELSPVFCGGRNGNPLWGGGDYT